MLIEERRNFLEEGEGHSSEDGERSAVALAEDEEEELEGEEREGRWSSLDGTKRREQRR